jgi:hypothetical protein
MTSRITIENFRDSYAEDFEFKILDLEIPNS